MSGTLPKGWAWAYSEELASPEDGALVIGPFGSDLKTSDYRDTGVPLVFVRDIRAAAFGGEPTKHIDPQKATQLRRHQAEPGDLLITKMGAPPGDTAIYPATRPPGIITADCIRLRPNPTLASTEFLRLAFRVDAVRSQIAERSVGVAQKKLSLERFRHIQVPLAPLAEQRRIADKLEALAAHNRRAKESLDAVPPLLDKLRQSILAAAFRGDLTADWRAKNPDVEPADKLLARVGDNHRSEWEQGERAKLITKGRLTSDNRWRDKYEAPSLPADATLDELPATWRWAPLDLVRAGDAAMVYGSILPGEDVPGGVPYVRPVDIDSSGKIKQAN
ncbi:MAG: restriction endonuclease subunit S [Myxococcales bacterium]|nr:restriction endonuclease subunit S [Myxococcales bacterium]